MPRETMQHPSVLNFLCEPGAIQVEALAEVEAGGDGTTRLPRFSMVAYTGGPMRIGGWRWPVIVDLAGMAIPSQSRPIRFGHDMQSGVGHTDAIQIDNGRLLASGMVSRDTVAAREIVTSARNGFPWQASIGASVEEFEFIKPDQKVLVNGREFLGPVNVVRKATLGEISFVDLGADGQTSANVAASATPLDQGESDMATAAGDSITRGAETLENTPANGLEAQAGVSVTATAPVGSSEPTRPPEITTVQRMRAEAAAESARIAAMRRICAGRYLEIEARAIREGWDATRCELEVLRASRPTAPAVQVRHETVNGTMLEAACLLTAKLDGIENLYDDQTMEAAQKRFRGGIGLQELLLEAAWANGYTGRSFRDSRSIMRFAFKPELEAGFSTVDIGGNGSRFWCWSLRNWRQLCGPGRYFRGWRQQRCSRCRFCDYWRWNYFWRSSSRTEDYWGWLHVNTGSRRRDYYGRYFFHTLFGNWHQSNRRCHHGSCEC